MSAFNPFGIASRKSPLAQTQSRLVRDLLARAAGTNGADIAEQFPIETFVTTGDQNLAGSLAEIGGKGLFTKEVEAALLSGSARFAVHSMKDMPAEMPEGLVIAAIPLREDPRDCFISMAAASPEELPDGARIGAASVRRIAQILSRRPDLQPQTLRGNVATRLEKLRAGEVEATFLALSGLKRLGASDEATKILSTEEMLPAVGQGALCIQARSDDTQALELARKINCPQTEVCVSMERAFLASLDGSCRTPIAGLAQFENETVVFRGEVLSLDGSERFTVERKSKLSPQDITAAKAVGVDAANELREKAGASFFERLQLP